MSASDRNPQYYCPISDKFINVREADLLVVSRAAKRDLPRAGEPVARANIALRRAYDEEREEVEEICHYFWDETEFFCFDQVFDIKNCINILAFAEDEIAGLLTWKKVENTQIIVLLNVYPEFQGQGIARLLLQEAMEQGRKQGCSLVKVATTNDDLPALCLYQKMGFRLSELCVGAAAEHHGDELPGFAGLPINDEIRLERKL